MTTFKKITEADVAGSVGIGDSLLAETGGTLKRVKYAQLKQDIATSVATPPTVYTLEQSSAPTFDVADKWAVHMYLSQVGGYMMKFKDGKAYAAKLSSTDWNYFADGTAVDDASKYETMVYLPTFYFKAEDKTMNVGGLNPIAGGHQFACPHWVGAYEMYVDGSGIGHSRPDVAPAHSKTMSAFWNCAQKLHKDAGLANYGFQCLIEALTQARYGNLNTQSNIGAGGQTSAWEHWRDVPMGLTRTLGDGTGKVLYNDSTVGDQYEVKLFGFEGLWGKLWEFRPGVRFYYDSSAGKRYAVIYDGNQVSNTATGRTVEFPLLNAGGAYITKKLLGEYWDALPTAVGGGSNTYYCDGYRDASGGQLLLVGGYASHGSRCGLAFASSDGGFSISGTNIGARLAFYGDPELVSGAEIVAM